MDDATRAYLQHVFTQRRMAMTDVLYHAIRHTSFTPYAATVLRAQLSSVLDQLINLLLAEPFDSYPAQTIGVMLASFHYLSPESIRRTHTVLARECVVGLSPDHLASLYPRLTAVLGDLVTGFSAQMKDTILAEQEQIRHALSLEQSRLRTALQEQESRLHLIITSVSIVLFAIDREGIVLLAEGSGLEALGCKPHSLIGRSVITMSKADPQLLQHIYRAMRGESFTVQVEICEYVFETHYSSFCDDQGVLQGGIGVAIDITTLTRTKTELMAVRRQMSEHIDAERRRIARYLHDHAVQHLLQISYQLAKVQQNRSIAVRAIGLTDKSDIPELEPIRQDVLAVTKHLRQVVGELRPPGQNELGLPGILSDYVARVWREGGPAMPLLTMHVDQHIPNPSPSIVRCLFQVAQEALRNSLRHAQAHHIQLELQWETDTLLLRVCDDGKGFTVPPSFVTLAQFGHFGLIGMAELVELFGGTLIIHAELGQGTEVVVRIPLQRNMS